MLLRPGEPKEHALSEIRDLRQRAPAADALLLFSCKARHMALGPLRWFKSSPRNGVA